MLKNLLVAHRGYSAVYPENTLLAFEKAVENGINCFELDLQRTKDGKLVCLHDVTVDRTTNGTGNIKDLTWDYVKTLDAGSWKNSQFAGEKIPSLDEVFERFKNENVFILIEMKNDNNYVGIEKQIADLIKKYMIEEQVLYFSFDWESVNKIKQYYPLIATGLLASGTSLLDDALSVALLNKHSFISWDYYTLLNNPDYITLWRKNGLSVNAWTVNNMNDLQTLWDIGVNILASDYANYLNDLKNINSIELTNVEKKLIRRVTPKVFIGNRFISTNPKVYNKIWKSGVIYI